MMPDRPVERTGAVALAGLVALGFALYAGAEMASLVVRRSWLHAPPSIALRLVVGVLADPRHPQRAWPASVGHSPMPGGATYAGAMYAGSALVLASGAIVAYRLTSTRISAGRPQGASAWAGARDLRALRVRAATPGRLTLGRMPTWWRRERLVATETRSSLLVLGPSQSGKTSGLAIPAIAEWSGPVVATSVKADLLRDTCDHRRAVGTVWVYDPTASTGVQRSGWSPIPRCAVWQTARQVATWLCAASRPRTGGGDDDFWVTAAGKLLAPHLFAAAVSGRSMSDVLRWIDTQDEDEVATILDRAGIREAIRSANASWARDDRTRSSIYATAEMVLDAFADPTVAASANTCEIRAETLLDGGSNTLYLCAPAHEQDRLRPVFATLLHEILTAAVDMVSARGRPLDPPLLLVLDEAANIAPLKDLDSLASTAAGQGIQLVTIWQDLAQIQARYGARASTVLNNHRAKLILSGVSDGATLECVSRLLGDSEIRDKSVTTDHRGATSTTRAPRERRLLTEAELRRIRPQQGVLVYGHLPPVWLRLRPWFRDRRLRHLLQSPRSPQTPTCPADSAFKARVETEETQE